MREEEKAIGLLDSGLGGLSVYRELKKQLPQERAIYFGDTGHAPYGEKTNSQVLEYVFSIADFLLQQEVKMIIIACNTATAVALDKVIERYNIPIIGVIQPGAEEAIKKTRNKKKVIVGTDVTIRNKSYKKTIKEMDSTIITYSNACSNQIIREMEERALKDESKIKALLKECVSPLIKSGVDTLVLGCTHYPFLSKYIDQELSPEIILVDPAEATVKEAKEWLTRHHLIYNTGQYREDTFFISGDESLFASIAQKLLGCIPGRFHKAPKLLSS